MKIREVIILLKADGWYLVTTKGSHQQYKHPTKPGRVTIAGHPGDDLGARNIKQYIKASSIGKGEGICIVSLL